MLKGKFQIVTMESPKEASERPREIIFLPALYLLLISHGKFIACTEERQ